MWLEHINVHFLLFFQNSLRYLLNKKPEKLFPIILDHIDARIPQAQIDPK